MTVRVVHKTQRTLTSKHSQTKQKQSDWKKLWACPYFSWSGRDGNWYHCSSQDMQCLKFFDKENVSVSEKPSALGFPGDIHWETFSILIHLPKCLESLQASRPNVGLPSGFTLWVLLLPLSVFLNKLVQIYKCWWMGACQRWSYPQLFINPIPKLAISYWGSHSVYRVEEQGWLHGWASFS